MTINKQPNPDIAVFQYRQPDGSSGISRDTLTIYYNMMVRDRTLHKTFYSGSVVHLHEFIKFVRSANIDFFSIHTKHTGADMDMEWGTPDEAVYIPSGMFWLSNRGFYISHIHSCFFRERWGAATDIMRSVISHLLDIKTPTGNHMFNTLRTSIPATNHLAIRWAKSVGFVELKPHIPYGAYISHTGNLVDLVELYITKQAR
jgi:hypothetical protein